MVNDLLVREGEHCTVPCLVTDPAVVNLSLHTCDGQPLPSGLSYSASTQRGILITNMSKEQEGCYVCAGNLGGTTVKSSQYIIEVRSGEPCCFLQEKRRREIERNNIRFNVSVLYVGMQQYWW